LSLKRVDNCGSDGIRALQGELGSMRPLAGLTISAKARPAGVFPPPSGTSRRPLLHAAIPADGFRSSGSMHHSGRVLDYAMLGWNIADGLRHDTELQEQWSWSTTHPR
jgi:hypothetical protein